MEIWNIKESLKRAWLVRAPSIVYYMFVNKFEHQFCCHSFQPVRCLFNETVMEAMWGLKNLMHVLVPGEKLKLTKKGCLPMSQGLKWLMDRHGFGVKPEMVSSAVDFLDVLTFCFVVYVFIYCDTILRVFGSLPWFATTNIRHATQYKPAPWFMQKLR